jgi:hypothetical protein
MAFVGLTAPASAQNCDGTDMTGQASPTRPPEHDAGSAAPQRRHDDVGVAPSRRWTRAAAPLRHDARRLFAPTSTCPESGAADGGGIRTFPARGCTGLAVLFSYPGTGGALTEAHVPTVGAPFTNTWRAIPRSVDVEKLGIQVDSFLLIPAGRA